MPGIANRTVPRLRAQPGSLLSLLPVRNVKDQPVGGSRREQTHTWVLTHAHNCARIDKYTHHYAYTRMDTRGLTKTQSMHATDSQRHSHTDKHTHTPAQTHSGLAHYGITSWGLQPGQAMRPQLRWFKAPRWVVTQSARWSCTPEWQQNSNTPRYSL